MSNLKNIIMNLDKNIDDLGKLIININNKHEMQNIYLCYADLITSVEELKLEFDFELKKQKDEWIKYLKETKRKADEIYKKEVWYSLYYYIKNKG